METGAAQFGIPGNQCVLASDGRLQSGRIPVHFLQSHAGLDLLEFHLNPVQFREGSLHRLQHGRGPRQFGLLRQIAESDRTVPDHATGIGTVNSRKALKQRALARTIASHDADSLLAVDSQSHVLQDGFVKVGRRNLVERQDPFLHRSRPSGNRIAIN